MAEFILPITYGDLVTWAGSLTARRPGHHPTPEAMQYEMAATLLRAYVGDAWSDENLLGRATEPYLKAKAADRFERMKMQLRVAALGELV
jgi:hypothetical protein